MDKVLKQKLLNSISYAFLTLFISIIFLAIIGGLSYFKIWKFELGKLPIFVYIVTIFMFSTFYFLLIGSKDYFQDFGMFIESSVHRKDIIKATIISRIFNIILVFGIIIGILFANKYLIGILNTRNINVYYDFYGVFKNESIIMYMPKIFMVISLCSMLFSALIFIAYKFGPIKIFVLFSALVIGINMFLYKYLTYVFNFIKDFNVYFYVAVGILSILLSILFTSFINRLDVK